MAFSWQYEDESGTAVGSSETFDNQGDAESWIGTAFSDLLGDGVVQVRLLDEQTEVYGPMSLLPD